jgi:hypothetical protein
LTDLAARLSTLVVRAILEDARAALRAGEGVAPTAEDVAIRSLARLGEEDPSTLRPLFNLTGTVLHTNLGRAQFAEAAIDAAVAAMRQAIALEFDLVSGKRERDDHVRALICALTGAEDATVVNNNAAVLVSVNTLAGGRDARAASSSRSAALSACRTSWRAPARGLSKSGRPIAPIGGLPPGSDCRDRRNPESPHV